MLTLVLAFVLFVTNQAAPAPVDAVGRARTVLTALAAQQFAAVEAQFTDEMKAAMREGRLAFMWTTLAAQAGPHQGCAPDSRVVAIAGKQMVITTCDFERARIDVQIAFDSAGRISGMALRPAAPPPASYALPSYADPATYKEQDVTIGSPEWPLPATLTLPAGDKSCPAIVLVHGSGPHDRDQSLGGNKPFKDLALGLASRGIAVLRYEKRSKAHARRMAALAALTVKEEVLDDAAAAVEWLATHPAIYPDRIFVLGHSLGGTLIPRLVAASKDSIAGAVVLAGAARPIETAIVEQVRYLAMLDGTISPAEQAQVEAAEKTAAAVRALGSRDTASGVVIGGVPASYWLDLRGYDAPAAAAALRTRMLVLQGERDYQVTMAEFERWKRALGARRDVTLRSYPVLNHLFMPGSGPPTPKEYDTPSHVDEQVIRDIAAWIRGG